MSILQYVTSFSRKITSGASHGDGHSPIDQFKVHKILDLNLAGLDISITNSTIMMFIITAVILLCLFVFSRGREVVPTAMQTIGESLFVFVRGIVSSSIPDESNANKCVPLVFSVFVFVLFSNVLGLVPMSFTVTSHIATTGAISAVVFLAMILTGIKHKGLLGFIKSLTPSGIPMLLVPFIFVIELIAYCARPLTLSVRLAANMIAGHTMIKVIIGFCAGLGVFAAIPLVTTSVITAFELFVACLQAYIYAILTSIYLNDSISEH